MDYSQMFFKRLRFLLSFHFSERDCGLILEDYREWYGEEHLINEDNQKALAGYNNINSIVHKICSESTSNVSRLEIIIHNHFLQYAILVVFRFVLEIILLKICGLESSYLCCSLIANVLFFLLGCTIMLPKRVSKGNVKKNVLIAMLPMTILLVEILIVPNIKYPVGDAYNFIIITLIIGLYVLSVIHGEKKLIKEEYDFFGNMINILGLCSMLFYIINQSHMFYTDMTQYAQRIGGIILIYFETLVLSLVYELLNKKNRG